MTDCLIIGFNEVDFDSYVAMLRSMGSDKGAYRDLNLAFITHDGKPYRSTDLLNEWHREHHPSHRPFSNVDFLWPVVTYLHTFLVRHGFTSDYVNLFHNEKQQLIDKLRAGQVRAVAITTTLYVWMVPILEIVELVRTHSPDTKIIVGGPYVHNQAQVLDEAMLFPLLESIGADVYVISAEGEGTLVKLLGALRDGAPLEGIENIVYHRGSDLVRTPEQRETNVLADNMVDYSLFSPEEFNGFVSLRTAKSCPFSCAFCAFPSRAGAYTYLPLDLVEKELDAIDRIGTVTTLSFIDDTFNVPKGRFKDILRLMIRKRYRFKWNSYLRADHADAEVVDLMAQSGCEGVFLGVESGSNTILQAMNKTSRREDYLRIIPQLRSAGIVSHANMIVGFPGETLDTVAETMAFVETAQPTFYRAQLWYCDPTTPVWQRRDELGIEGSGFAWAHPTMDSETAANLVERFFCDIKHSTWLPQYGFEPWSIYYLQRRGMPLDQLRRFVNRFNDAVRAKLENPGESEVPAHLLEAIRAECGFEQVSPSAPRSVRPPLAGELQADPAAVAYRRPEPRIVRLALAAGAATRT